MKQKIENILEETGYKESRAAKMDLNDILKYVSPPSPLILSDDGSADYYQPFMTLISISPDPCVAWCRHSIVSTIIYFAR